MLHTFGRAREISGKRIRHRSRCHFHGPRCRLQGPRCSKLTACPLPGVIKGANRLGAIELLLPRACDAGVPCHRLALLLPAAPVAAPEAQGERPGEDTVLRRVPARCAGTDRPGCPDAEFPVGESVSPCPRAGCPRWACPDLWGLRGGNRPELPDQFRHLSNGAHLTRCRGRRICPVRRPGGGGIGRVVPPDFASDKRDLCFRRAEPAMTRLHRRSRGTVSYP
jgi:hypothetical protein